MKKMFRHATRILKTEFCKLLKTSDRSRWADHRNLSSSWSNRTETIAGLIPSGSSIIEFGCGNRALERLLPEKCDYIPSDICDRGDGTLVYDLNKDIQSITGKFDIAVFSGVFEYIFDPEKVVKHLSNCCKKIIASYADIALVPTNRSLHGWVNSFTEDRFVQIFRNHGYSCVECIPWENQKIYVFELAVTQSEKSYQQP